MHIQLLNLSCDFILMSIYEDELTFKKTKWISIKILFDFNGMSTRIGLFYA